MLALLDGVECSQSSSAAAPPTANNPKASENCVQQDVSSTTSNIAISNQTLGGDPIARDCKAVIDDAITGDSSSNNAPTNPMGPVGIPTKVESVEDHKKRSSLCKLHILMLGSWIDSPLL